MRFLKLQVVKSALSQPIVEVVPWELPILQLIHGEGQVIQVGEVEVAREYPDPASEFNRLNARYGSISEGGEPKSVVVLVYGHNPERLSQVIEQEKQLAAAAKGGKSKSKAGAVPIES